MFLELAVNADEARTLFGAHPTWITALVENYWRLTGNPAIEAWPQNVITQIETDFNLTVSTGPFNNEYDHLIYAYLIENTRIYDIFAKVLKTYRSGEQLGRPGASRQFWDTTERLFFSDPSPNTVWSITSRTRPDEMSQRMSTYWWMLGLTLAHAGEIAQTHPYQKPAGANVEFIPAFETFAREAWRGIVNRRNRQGANDTDNACISSEALRISNMFATRRISRNLSREEFRAVAVMSWLHLALSFDSPAVLDLAAGASSEEQRLRNIAERVGMAPHPKSRALFALARPFSALLRAIEAGLFNNAAAAARLYRTRRYRGLAETVIEQYSQAMGQDLKAVPVAPTPQAVLPERQLPPPQRPLQLVPGNQQAASPAQVAQSSRAN